MQQSDDIGGPGAWRTARILAIKSETPRVKSLTLDVPGWPGHLAGQHLDVRLTAEDGYQAQRSYSIASAPENPHLELTIEHVAQGEVSSYFEEVVRPGDTFEVRGPIGRYFVWTSQDGGPLFLIAGGSGIAPLMAMLRHARNRAATIPITLLYSSRTEEDIIYRAELDELGQQPNIWVVHTLTRSQPAGWTGGRRRIDGSLLTRVGFSPANMPRIYVCGSTPLVEDVSGMLVELGHEAAAIKTERFGPTGTR